MSEHDSTQQFDGGLERADAILGAAKDAGISTESGRNMCAAAKDLYHIEIERIANQGNLEQAAGLAKVVSERFRDAGDEDITDFFEMKTGVLYSKVEDSYDSQISENKKAGRPDMAAQIAHNAAKVFKKAGLAETARKFDEIAASYLEMCKTYYQGDAQSE